MTVARVVANNKVVEIRQIEMEDIPFHKRYMWKTVIDAPPVVNTQLKVVTQGPLVVTANNTHVEYQYSISDRIYPEMEAFRVKLALEENALYETAEAAIANTSNNFIHIIWDSANLWHKDGRFMTYLAGEIGLSNSEVDALFVQAALVDDN